MNFPTVIVLLVVLALIIVAILSLRKGKGTCSCDGKEKSDCAGCPADCPFRR